MSEIDICDSDDGYSNSEKRYFCNNCGELFTKIAILNVHKRLRHATERPYHCDDCDARFVRSDDLKQHMCQGRRISPDCGNELHRKMSEGGEEKSLADSHSPKSVNESVETDRKCYKRCVLCDKRFKLFENEANKDGSLRCFTCIFNTTGVKRFRCEHCDYSTMATDKFKAHAQKHTGENLYKCATCDKAFANSYLFERHRRQHTGERPYLCDICGLTFVAQPDLSLHKRKHRDDSDWRIRTLLSTMKTEDGECVPTLPPLIGSSFECAQCDHVAMSLARFKAHVRTHEPRPTHQCKYCPYVSSSFGYLQVHERKHTGEKPFQCSVCSRRFTSKGQASLCLRKHQGGEHNKPFQCNVCRKSFFMRESLVNHYSTHVDSQNVYKNQCKICCDAFATPLALKKHMRLHVYS